LIRPANEGEVSLPVAYEKCFVHDDDGVKGHVCVSRIQQPHGVECWIHQLEGEGAVELMLQAWDQATEWGFDEVWANVSNPRLAKVLMGRGWTPEQVILRKERNGN